MQFSENKMLWLVNCLKYSKFDVCSSQWFWVEWIRLRTTNKDRFAKLPRGENQTSAFPYAFGKCYRGTRCDRLIKPHSRPAPIDNHNYDLWMTISDIFPLSMAIATLDFESWLDDYIGRRLIECLWRANRRTKKLSEVTTRRNVYHWMTNYQDPLLFMLPINSVVGQLCAIHWWRTAWDWVALEILFFFCFSFVSTLLLRQHTNLNCIGRQASSVSSRWIGVDVSFSISIDDFVDSAVQRTIVVSWIKHQRYANVWKITSIAGLSMCVCVFVFIKCKSAEPFDVLRIFF